MADAMVIVRRESNAWVVETADVSKQFFSKSRAIEEAQSIADRLLASGRRPGLAYLD